MSLLKVEGLVKAYGRRRVVDGINFEVGSSRNCWASWPERCG